MNTSISWLDLHTHLDDLEISPEEAVKNAKLNQVQWMITIGTNPSDHLKVLDFVSQFSGVVFGTLGVHPHEAAKYDQDVQSFLIKNAPHSGVVGIGEIGLDYYYNKANHDVQKKAFESQMEVAAELGLPVEIHTRDAEKDTFEILKTFEGRVRGVLHCFTGTQWLAEKALELGYDISVSGIITFKNAEDLRSVIRQVPLDRLHIETDAPYLAPVPHRGKKNQPCYVIETAAAVAQLKNVTLEELSRATLRNARRLFPKIKLAAS